MRRGLCAACVGKAIYIMNSKVFFNRAPLPRNEYAPLPLTAVKPEGWLREQLRIQAEGLTGHLYEMWPDVSDECAWLGGKGDAWERAPYYLDGLLPLAYLLDDERLIKQANRYVEWMLASQREDGFFGPEGNEDWWPRMVALKALIQYYTATTDERVPKFMLKYFAYQYKNMDSKPMMDWAVARCGENIMCALWLYNLTGAPFLMQLCKRLEAQTLDWGRFFNTLPFTRSMARHIPWKEMEAGRSSEAPLKGADRPYTNTQYHYSHVVNVAMGLKTPALSYLLHGGAKDRQAFYDGWQKLMKHHGVAMGMFTGDEHLSGNSPTQGTELCAVVEMMFSLETLIWSLGDMSMGDKLEKLAFNALPATISADMKSHQYLQQVNQVRATDEVRSWYNNGSDSNTFGFEPNFGCCTANMHQGWPKFAESLWMATRDDGLAAVSYAPCTVRFRAGGQPVRVRVEGEYPFGEGVRMTISVKQPRTFPIYLRVPEWCEGFKAECAGEVAGIKDGVARIERMWHSGDVISITLPMAARNSEWFHQSRAVEYGPLLMALPIAEQWRELRPGKYSPDYADYEVLPMSEWNWALVDDAELASRRAQRSDAPAGFAGKSPLTLKVKAARAPEWGMDGASCANPPIGIKCHAGDVGEIELTPYGTSRLHVAQFPVAKVED